MTALGALAGLTIFLGLPVARLENKRTSWLAFLNALAKWATKAANK